jgi:uncharacterized protein
MNTQAPSASLQSSFLRPFWSGVIGPPWVVSLVVFALLAGMRFLAIFSPYPLQELFFLQVVGMWALPFAILTAAGRRQIGLTERGMTFTSMALSALAGALCALLFFCIGMFVFGDSPNNWCVSIRNYLHIDEMRGLTSPVQLFLLYSLPAIFLNPIGEEILFRGFIQQSFARRFNPAIATLVNSILFGVVYLSVHGLWRDASGFHLRVGSAALALLLMTGIGAAFTMCRTLSGSLWPAMAAHAAFNLTILGSVIRVYLR